MKLYVESKLTRRSSIVKAVVNTGFRSHAPDLSLPLPLARELGLYPPPSGSYSIEVRTAGGTVNVYMVPRALLVKVVVEDRETPLVEANALVNPLDDEVLISDYLAEELGIQVLYPRRGLWRFADDEPGKIRESTKG